MYINSQNLYCISIFSISNLVDIYTQSIEENRINNNDSSYDKSGSKFYIHLNIGK